MGRTAIATRRDETSDRGVDGSPDTSLDDALARIGELSRVLWALRDAHVAEPALRGPRCRECRRRFPCRTARLVALPRRAVR
jgi:hypothetical protein